MYYRRLNRGLRDVGQLVPENYDVYSNVDWQTSDIYLSCYKYTEEQRTEFLQTHTISSVGEAVTDKIWFDLDCLDDIEKARSDTSTLVSRLSSAGIRIEDLLICFSGNKGFSVELSHTSLITKPQVLAIVKKLTTGLPTFDPVIYDCNRIFRLAGSKHDKSGYYKTPLTHDQLTNYDISLIRKLATTPVEFIEAATKKPWVSLPKEWLILKEEKKAPKPHMDIDFSKKIKGMSNCKWALMNGYQVKSGSRNDKLLAILSTLKQLNFAKEMAVALATQADAYGAESYGGEEVDTEKVEEQAEYVWGPHWRGGMFTCKDGRTPWLKELCDSLGPYKCAHKENDGLVSPNAAFNEFLVYAKDIDKNTIRTGISTLDEKLRIVVGQMVGILGAPSSGKSSCALEILEHTSKQGLLSVFYSLDMASSEMFQKIAQRVTGFTADKLFHIFKYDEKESANIGKKVEEAYKNVKFCFDTGISVAKIEQTIDDFEEANGSKVKLLLIDYNELLSSAYSDMTASSGFNAGELKRLTNSRNLCTMSLLQPPKIVGDASDEITSYRSIKGSSLLEQCFSIIIGIYRPGFNPENDCRDDKFLVMNVLKNRLGNLCSLNFRWEGLRGQITPASYEDEADIKDLKEAKRAANSGSEF